MVNKSIYQRVTRKCKPELHNIGTFSAGREPISRKITTDVVSPMANVAFTGRIHSNQNRRLVSSRLAKTGIVHLHETMMQYPL